ncbi:MAG: hypothetical protein MUF00_20800 [Gemmatimonadaceae bacterium]|nr:hypothetical protein [Gemmatimonadaceae bacterium]
MKARYPRCHVTWVTRPEARAVLARNPAVDRILTIDENYLEILLVEEFDLAIGPEADQLSASIMRMARASEFRGFIADGRGGVRAVGVAAAEWWQTSLDDELKQRNRRTYGSWLYAVCALEGPVAAPVLSVTDTARARVAERLAARAGEKRRYVCINTGASGRWKEKRWKAAHYQQFARLIGEAEPNVVVVLVGGPNEVALNRELLAAGIGFIDGGTANTMDEFGALVAASEWVLTPDSLGYHVACATATPALCLVGPTAPWELDLYGRNLVLYSDLSCIACYRSECPFPRTCMDMLAPQAAWENLQVWWRAGGADYRPIAAEVSGVIPIIGEDTPTSSADIVEAPARELVQVRRRARSSHIQ